MTIFRKQPLTRLFLLLLAALHLSQAEAAAVFGMGIGRVALAVPTAAYLVETDPRFTRFASFISSDYMLTRLGLDPAATEKRLGDGYYEQQLVRDQIIRARGSNNLGPYASLDAEYQALLDAGIAFAREFGISPGITLSKDQIAGLTHDMVWLEERVVDGQKVLVPVVYLLASDSVRPTGAILAGKTVTLAAADIRNSGTIGGSSFAILEANVGKTLVLSPMTRLAIRNDGVLGEQLAAQLSQDLGIPNLKVLQNNSNHGLDLYAYDEAANRYYVIEARSSEAGNFADPTVSAADFLKTRAERAAKAEGVWDPKNTLQGIQQDGQAIIDNLRTNNASVTGIKMEVSIPKQGQIGTPTVTLKSWN